MALFERSPSPVAAATDPKSLRRIALMATGVVGAIALGGAIASFQSPSSSSPVESAAPLVAPAAVAPVAEFVFASAPAPTEVQFVAPEGPLPPFQNIFAAPQQPAPVLPTGDGGGSQAAPSNSAPVGSAPAGRQPTNTVPAPAPAPAQPAAPSNFYLPAAPAGDGYIAGQVFNLMNAERVAAGLSPLSWDNSASTIGRIRSQQMIDQGYFGHTDPFGYSMYWELLKHYGIGYAWAGENLQRNNYPYEQQAGVAVTGFMNSTAHRDNVLYSGFNRVGIGAVTAPNGTVYISVIFLG